MCQHNLPCSIVLPTACFPEGPSPHFTFCSFWRRRPRLEAVWFGSPLLHPFLLVSLADSIARSYSLVLSDTLHFRYTHIVGRESKPRNSDYFYQINFLSSGNTKCMTHILSNSRSFRPIRTPLKSINHASKYRIYEKFPLFWCLFYRDTRFSHEKNAQNDVT